LGRKSPEVSPRDIETPLRYWSRTKRTQSGCIWGKDAEENIGTRYREFNRKVDNYTKRNFFSCTIRRLL
jgi:hypothetical protein